jgi:uncharacterized protein involved in exopolysaccharide biosynthesis/Mrp family chromosome partitioning ATPase
MPEGDRSLGTIFSELNRKKWWILLPTLLALAGAIVFVNVATPKFTGEAKILLEHRDNYFTRPDKEQRGTDPPLDTEAVASQVQAIMSRDLALKVIKKLDLAGSEEFDPVKKEMSTLKRILALLGLTKNPLAVPPEERVLENYFDKLLVFNVGKSRVISVEFSSKNPELASRAANAVAEEYISFSSVAKKETTQGASAWLAQAIDPMRQKVAEAEAKVEAFRAENGLLIGASNATIATQQLGEMNTQISAARSVQTELSAKAKMIREALKSGRIFETSEVVNNELVRRLLEQRVSMKTQIALEERSLLPGHPRMKELHAQIADLESQIRTAAERTARTLENDARLAGSRLQSMQADFESQKKTAANANEHEVQLRALEREARALRDNYEQYLAKYRDSLSRDADAAAPADARIISRAVVPQLPAFPKKVPIILLVTLATLVLCSAIVITRYLFSVEGSEADDMPVMMPMQAAQPMQAQQPMPQPMPMETPAASGVAPAEVAMPPQAVPPVQTVVTPPQRVRAPAPRPAAFAAAEAEPMAVAPPAHRPPPPPPAPAPTPAFDTALVPLAEDLASLRQADTGLVIDCRAHDTSVQSTTTAMPLARLMSSMGRAVLVACAGVGTGERAAGQSRRTGLSDMVAGMASFGDIIHRDRASALHIIPFGGRPEVAIDPADPTFADLLDALVQTYDYVVLDVGTARGALAGTASLADAVVLVATRDDSDPAVGEAFRTLNAQLPGRVTIVVEEPDAPTPMPVNVSAA